MLGAPSESVVGGLEEMRRNNQILSRPGKDHWRMKAATFRFCEDTEDDLLRKADIHMYRRSI